MTDFSNPPDWVSDAVFYQIFPDRFAASDRVPKPGPMEPWDTPPTTFGFKGGDLLGIVEHLDYIQGLGVNALYLTPVFASASNHRYHTYDYYTVDPLLGGNEALRALLDACHARGMRVILDGVFNHSGRGFWPFHHVVETGASSPYVDWFYIDRAALAAGGELRPYPLPGERRPLGYSAWWNLPALPKLNTNNPGMREHSHGRGRALVALRDRRLATGRGRGDRRRLLASSFASGSAPSTPTLTSWRRSGTRSPSGRPATRSTR